MSPLAECSSQPDDAASVRVAPAPLDVTCTAAMLAAMRHAKTRAPRAPALRLRVMLSSPLEIDWWTVIRRAPRWEGVWKKAGYGLVKPMRSYIFASVGPETAFALPAPAARMRWSSAGSLLSSW